jgi:hypothetical protein
MASTRSAPAIDTMFAINFALIATRGWSFRSCLAYPKYGMTEVTRAALARLAASMRSSSSIMFSAGGLVGWMMYTSRPRTFSSILTNSSPSAKRLSVTWQSGWPRWAATSSARGRLADPLRSSIWLRDSDRSVMVAARKPSQAKGVASTVGAIACYPAAELGIRATVRLLCLG